MRIEDLYNFSAPLFFFKFIFLIEILAAEVLIFYRMKRKKGFVWRSIVAVAVLLAIAFALPIPFYNALYTSALFMVIFACTLVALKFCLDEPWANVVYCGFVAYTEQHIAYQLYNFFCLVTGIGAGNDLYGEVAVGEGNGLEILVFVACHVVVYLVGWAMMTYRVYRKGGGGFTLRRIKFLILSIVIVAGNVILNAFVVYDLPPDTSLFVRVIIIFYNLFSCILALYLQMAVIGQEEIASELRYVEALWNKNKQIYELSKENVDFINMKCHDLRHRIRDTRRREFIDENELKEIEQALNIYDGLLRTGNEALDVILSEESIFCSRNNIQLICDIDGAQLNFMQPVDLYVIFQNAIHNAIDAVMKLGEPERRIVRISVRRVENMISIHEENEVAEGEKIVFENGLPVTGNKDRNLHGFGMRSMLLSVEKYDGCLYSEVHDGVFHLELMVPVPQSDPEEAK